MLKFLIKEAALLTAFVLMGGLLLLCYWSSFNLNQGLASEFKNPKVSVVLKGEDQSELRKFLDNNSEVISYDVFNSNDNKEKLAELYPEMRNVIEPLDLKFFPISAVIAVKDAGSFLKELGAIESIVAKQILHEPPHKLIQFLNGLTVVLLSLWLLTLGLVLYFNIERIMVEESARWSLMKMLGAKPLKLFMPLLGSQILRVGLAAVLSALSAYFISHQIQSVISWSWVSLPSSLWFGYFAVSLAIASLIAAVLFRHRFGKVSFG